MQEQVKQQQCLDSIALGILVFLVLAVGVFPDLIWGGQQSTMPRFLIPSYAGLQLAVSYLLAVRIEAGNFIQKKNLADCFRDFDHWWIGLLRHQFPSRSVVETSGLKSTTFRVARFINSSDRPLVIVSESLRTVFGDVMSLNYFTRFKSPVPIGCRFGYSDALAGFSDVFLYDKTESFPVPSKR